jgi:hypothetical protein
MAWSLRFRGDHAAPREPLADRLAQRRRPANKACAERTGCFSDFSHAEIGDFPNHEAHIRRLKRLKHFNDCGRADRHAAKSGEIAAKWRFPKTFTAFLRAKILSSTVLVMRFMHGCSDALALFVVGLHAYIRINRETRAANTLPSAESPRKGDHHERSTLLQ